MSLSFKENMLKAIRFEAPEYIPMRFAINSACWNHYDQSSLIDLMEGHKLLFPDYKRPEGQITQEYLLNARADAPYTDPWGCVWETTDDGITGSVHGHPLESYENFADYKAPDPEKTDGTYPVDWGNFKKNPESSWMMGLPHGHTFLRLIDIRGYENLLFDMVDESPEFLKLLAMVTDFNYKYVLKCLSFSPLIFSYPEDLGMQVGPMLSPEHFRKYIKPAYKKLMKPALDKGCIIHMHSDGDIRQLADDLVDAGVRIINLQDLVNGIDWIAEKYAGRLCIDLDIDRQKITRFGTPEQIDALIREEVEKLSSPEGGLMMVYGLYPGVPLENIKAIMDAMEKYMFFHS